MEKTIVISNPKQFFYFLSGIFNLTSKESEYASILFDILGREGELTSDSRLEFAKRANINMNAVYVWVKKFREKKLMVDNHFNPTIQKIDTFIINVKL